MKRNLKKLNCSNNSENLLENKTTKIYKQEKHLTDIIQNIKSGLSLKIEMILKQLMIKNVDLKVHKDKVQYLIKKINFD